MGDLGMNDGWSEKKIGRAGIICVCVWRLASRLSSGERWEEIYDVYR